jgi:hypothetical protein
VATTPNPLAARQQQLNQGRQTPQMGQSRTPMPPPQMPGAPPAQGQVGAASTVNPPAGAAGGFQQPSQIGPLTSMNSGGPMGTPGGAQQIGRPMPQNAAAMYGGGSAQRGPMPAPQPPAGMNQPTPQGGGTNQASPFQMGIPSGAPAAAPPNQLQPQGGLSIQGAGGNGNAGTGQRPQYSGMGTPPAGRASTSAPMAPPRPQGEQGGNQQPQRGAPRWENRKPPAAGG